MDYFELQSVITTNIALLFTSEYTLQEKILSPIYAALFMIKVAFFLYSEMSNNWVLSSVIIGVVVHAQNHFKDYMARRYNFKTLVCVYSPYRRSFNYLKVLFWMIFSPLYPMFLVVTKSIMYIPAIYALPFYIVMYIFRQSSHYNSKVNMHAISRSTHR